MATLDGMPLLPNIWNDNSGWDAIECVVGGSSCKGFQEFPLYNQIQDVKELYVKKVLLMGGPLTYQGHLKYNFSLLGR
eukprot:1198973-Amphidinium_carterae.1